jgi:hypothetical protein
MNTLPKDIISKIGEYLDINDRGNCEASTKDFSAIHEGIINHEMTVTLNINYKLKNLFKKHINLKNLTLHFKNNQYSPTISSGLIPPHCKLWVNIEKSIYINEILLRLQNVVVYSLNISMIPESMVEAEPFISNTYSASVLIWKKQLNLLYYPNFLMTCSNIVINVPEEISIIETSFLSRANMICITTCKLDAITEFDNVTHLIVPKLGTVPYISSAKRLQEIWLWNIAVEKFMYVDYPLYKLIKLVPKQVTFYIYASNHPFIISILQTLRNNFQIKFIIFYDSKNSYLISKIIQFIIPNVQVINLVNSHLYSKSCRVYTPDPVLVNINNKKQVWFHMTDFDRMIWYTYFC